MGTIDVFMHRILDYAGMFPPARLPFEEAVRCFEIFQHHQRADFLNCFVLPSDHLGRMNGHSLPLSLLISEKEIGRFPLPSAVASMETVWSGDEDLLALLDSEVSPETRVFLELDWRKPFAPLMEKVARRGPRCGVKLRTGGLAADTVPPAAAVADFLLCAAKYQRAVKATAGLHVPAPNYDASVGTRMHGFLNFFCAGFLAFSGRADHELLVHVLADFGYSDFKFGDQALRCGTTEFSIEEVGRLRRQWLPSFGSCSFLEPVEHLAKHGIL